MLYTCKKRGFSFLKAVKTSVLLLFLTLLPFLLGKSVTAADPQDVAKSRFLILWNDAQSDASASALLAELSPDLTLLSHTGDFSVCLGPSENKEEFLSLPKRSEDIRIVETDTMVSVFDETGNSEGEMLPDGPSLAQWWLHNSGQYTFYLDNQPYLRSSKEGIDIDYPQALTTLASADATREVVVAVIDTGVDITHPALSGHIYTNPGEIPQNGIDDDGNGYIDDVYGWDFYHDDNTVCHYSVSEDGLLSADLMDNDTHGTHCAGIIAASGEFPGVAGSINVRILPLKIHGGENRSGSVASAVKAIKYAQAAGAEICNLSWGTQTYSEVLETVIRESGMLFVTAAGNDGNNNNAKPTYPACFNLPNVISVGYVNQFGELAELSNYGSSTVDFVAPGVDIYSTGVGGGYLYLSGSSMAAPIVSGTAALLYACGDNLYPQNIKEILVQTLQTNDAFLDKFKYSGILNAGKALSALYMLDSDTDAPRLSPSRSFQRENLFVDLHPEDIGHSGLRILCYASGKRNAAYFRHGSNGYTLSDSVIALAKPGVYTFFAADYAGNETVFTYTLADDTSAPTLSPVVKMPFPGTFQVLVHANDTESGIKRIAYLAGEHSLLDFSSGGTELPLTDPEFYALTGETYTVFTADYRGNKSIEVITMTPIPAERLYLSTQECTLYVGESMTLAVLMFPQNTTEVLRGVMSDSEVAEWTPDMKKITALKPGETILTVTAGNLKGTCVLHIVEAKAQSDKEI